jgi:hypothetical protein
VLVVVEVGRRMLAQLREALMNFGLDSIERGKIAPLPDVLGLGRL